MYITRLASNDIFSPSNIIHLEVGRAKDLSAPFMYTVFVYSMYSSPSKMEPVGLYETLVTGYQTTQCHIPKDGSFHSN